MHLVFPSHIYTPAPNVSSPLFISTDIYFGPLSAHLGNHAGRTTARLHTTRTLGTTPI